ncbi:recombinase family protein [Akkermansiaceae bacterium]|nr:recombinase family protein [bacterium]MDB4666061.1 recombinase family protein [Akkermansiaceae bacterium]
MKIVTYTRVSTKRQGQSGLGLEAQEAAIQNYIQEQSADVVGGFVEIESGKKSNRPELAKAIALAKKTKSKLVVAKLDRLARNVHFISGLLESKVDFVALDFPEANTFTLQIMAALAEQEARLISERTRAALAAAKRRGVILGAYGRTLADKNISAADAWASAISDTLISVIASCRKKTLQNVANKLNKKGITTRTGKTFAPTTVMNLMKRLDLSF